MSREERAWAAGLFDGEGGTYFHQPNKRWRGTILVRMGQTDPFVLERIRDVLGVGVVRGPMDKGGNRKPVWMWDVSNTPQARQALELMWPWLSPQKREQAERVYAIFDGQAPPKAGLGFRNERCKNGHQWVDYYYENGKRRCGLCRRDYNRERYARRQGKSYRPLMAARGRRRDLPS